LLASRVRKTFGKNDAEENKKQIFSAFCGDNQAFISFCPYRKYSALNYFSPCLACASVRILGFGTRFAEFFLVFLFTFFFLPFSFG
jgi:hypothetical protein